MDIPFLSLTLPELIASIGYLGVFVIVFLESGVPLGIILPLPGDTLLFSGGILAASGTFDLVPLILTVIVAAILGDSAGYWFGKRYGPALFEKETIPFMNKRMLERTIAFYAKYGKSALVLARFMPMFRTVVPIFAGVGSMHYRDFLIWNIIGACIWGVSIPVLGYYLGQMIPNIDHYILPILLIIIGISTFTMVREYYKEKRNNKVPQSLE